MGDCIFCQIVEGIAPASVIYEDALAIALMDLNPVNDGHALVIPRKHVALLADTDEQTAMHLFRIAQRTAAAIRASGVRCEGVNLFLADGEAAFQEVFHLHLHVFPRYEGDAFRISADWQRRPRQELDAVAQEIRSAYERLWSSPTP